MPRDPTVLDHLGDVYRRLGESDLALNAWQRALDSGAEDPDGVRRKIEREHEVISEKALAESLEEAETLPVPR